jgi:hypothetical protein
MVSKARIIVSVLVIAIFAVLFIPPETNSNEPIAKIVESDFISSDDINMDQVIIDQAIQEYSIIETNRVFTESNDSLITRFLDEQGVGLSEKFGIETQVAVFDSDGNVYNESDVFGISELSVVDEQGRLLDLGSIQVTFESISKDIESTSNVWGIVEFYLDDEKIDSKYLWGSYSNSNRNLLSVVNLLSIIDNNAKTPSFSEQEKQNFTFTLADEGKDWLDGSEHSYRVVLTEIHSELNSSNDYKKFDWKGQHIAYELKVKVNEQKKVILDENNSAIEIFKSDSVLRLCGNTSLELVAGNNGGEKKYTAKPPKVTVKLQDGTVLFVADFKPKMANYSDKLLLTDTLGRQYYSNNYNITNLLETCQDFTGIPRNDNIIFEIDGKQFTIETPKSQKNYNMKADFIPNIQWIDSGIRGSEPHHIQSSSSPTSAICVAKYNSVYTNYECAIPVVDVKITSDFGYIDVVKGYNTNGYDQFGNKLN